LLSKVEGNTFYLTLSGAKVADQGKYKAIIKNKIGQAESREAALNISSKTKI
jgi:hypothetical protein